MTSLRRRPDGFSFHLPAGLDNSGFVGWLATELKRRLGTGVFVICGRNGDRGGIYDYWGVPVRLRTPAAEVLRELRAPVAPRVCDASGVRSGGPESA